MTTNINEASKPTGMRLREDSEAIGVTSVGVESLATSSPPRKKQRVEGGEYSLLNMSLEERLLNPKARISVDSNYSNESINDMFENAKSKGLKFPPDLEEDIKSLDDDDEKNGHDFKVVILGNESDHWKVQISFLEDWMFTLIIKKDMKEEVTAQFATPCSYQGYPLSVEADCVEFPTFHRADVTWYTAAIYPPDPSDFPYISICLKADPDDDSMGRMLVIFDEVFMALASTRMQVGIRFQPNVGNLVDLFNYFTTANCRLPFRLADEIRDFSPNWLGPQKVTMDSNVVQISFSDWVFTFVILKYEKYRYTDEKELRFTYPCTYKNYNLVEKGNVVDSFEFPTYAASFGAVSWDSVKFQNKGIYISLIDWGASIDSTGKHFPRKQHRGGIIVDMQDVYNLLMRVDC